MAVDVLALVTHGTEDPILPYAHGVALAQTIPGADLLTLDRAGHEIPRCYVEAITRRMLGLQTRVRRSSWWLSIMGQRFDARHYRTNIPIPAQYQPSTLSTQPWRPPCRI